MTFLERLLSPPVPRASLDPSEERLWDPVASVSTQSGTRVDAESAMKVSAFFAGVRLLSFVVGRLPLGVFLQDTRDQDKTHWAYRLLAKSPNHWQTPFEFKQAMFSDVLRWGNGYAEKMGGRSGDVEELQLLHPSRVTPERLSSGALVYKVMRDNLRPETLPQDRLLHWRSPFADGPKGLSLLSYARETLGHALAQSQFSQRQFSQGLLHKFAATMPSNTTLSKETKDQLKEALSEKAGLTEAHRVLILPGGLELKPMSMSMADAQFLQQEEFTMVQLSQFLGIPPHMLELVSRSTSWGQGIQEQTIGFAVFTVDPWLTQLEESIDRDLLDGGEGRYSKFNRKALLAANMRDRSAFYVDMGRLEAMTINEIRALEDMDAVLWGDRPPALPNQSIGPTGEGKQGASAQIRAIATQAAGRLVRKEMARIAYLQKRNGTDREAFARAVNEFYEDHAEEVSQALAIPSAKALGYCDDQRALVLEGGLELMEQREQERIEHLATLALDNVDGQAKEPESSIVQKMLDALIGALRPREAKEPSKDQAVTPMAITKTKKVFRTKEGYIEEVVEREERT